MLTKTVTKAFPGPNHVGLHLKFVDDSRDPADQIVIDKDYMEQWASGTTIPDKVIAKIQRDMQDDINAYKALSARFNHGAYGDARNTVDAGLIL